MLDIVGTGGDGIGSVNISTGATVIAAAAGAAKEALAASVPFPKRLGDPDEFAQAVEFLVTCGYMNAESIRVDGAIRMAPR